MFRLLQLTLDFFDTTPSVPVRETQAKAPPKRPPKPKDAAEKAADEAPTERLDQVLAPIAFRHPRASREAVRDTGIPLDNFL